LKDVVIKYGVEVVCSAVALGIGAAYKRLAKKLHQQICDQKALKEGTLALLRSEIIRIYDKYTYREQIPIYAMENVLALYDAYHELGGNGTITKLIEELRALPSQLKEEL
jgi:uncharacterized protein YsxB (DUF464 family)